ncbi:MAG: LamG-like jellyroll fold domain-containing protein [Verrucomicrobiota bacterium]
MKMSLFFIDAIVAFRSFAAVVGGTACEFTPTPSLTTNNTRMKKRNHLILCALSVLGLAFTSISQAALVGYWSFNEGTGTTAADASGNGYSATIVAGTQNVIDGWSGGATTSPANIPPTATPGVGDNALDSLGYNSHADVTSPGFISTMSVATAYSVSMWMNLNTGGSYPNMFAFMNGNARQWFTQLGSGGDTNMYSWFASPHYTIGGSAGNPTQDAWHNFVFTQDGSIFKVYRDGANIYSTASTVKIGTFTSFQIGGASYNSGTFSSIEGSIDEVAVYNNALTASEVTTAYNSGVPINLVPEPASAALFSLALCAFSMRRRRTRA